MTITPVLPDPTQWTDPHLDSFAPHIDGDPVEPEVKWKDEDNNGCDDKVTTYANGKVKVEYYEAVPNPLAYTDECVYWKTEEN